MTKVGGEAARRALAALVALAWAAYFLVPGSPPFTILAYAVAAAWVAVMALGGAGEGSGIARPVLVTLALFGAWCAAGSLGAWLAGASAGRALGPALQFPILVAFVLAHGALGRWRERVGLAILGAAGLGALVSLALFLRGYDFEGRLVPFGRADHPILGAAGYALALGLGAEAALARRLAGRARLATVAAGLVVLAAIVATGSRGVMLGLATAGAAALIHAARGRLRRGGVALASGLLVAATIGAVAAGFLLGRGDNHRFAVWREAGEAVVAAPLAGAGPLARIETAGAGHAHNMLVGTAYAHGLVGLALLLALLVARGAEIARGLPSRRAALGLWLLVLVLTVGQFDLGQLLRGPVPTGLVAWLPLLLPIGGGALES